jgi:hypothetical protein
VQFRTENREGNLMKPNIGNLDRIIRIVVGVVLIAYALRLGFPETGWNWVGWIGVVPILTALVRVCPAYAIMGIRTGR